MPISATSGEPPSSNSPCSVDVVSGSPNWPEMWHCAKYHLTERCTSIHRCCVIHAGTWPRRCAMWCCDRRHTSVWGHGLGIGSDKSEQRANRQENHHRQLCPRGQNWWSFNSLIPFALINKTLILQIVLVNWKYKGPEECMILRWGMDVYFELSRQFECADFGTSIIWLC